MRLAQHWSAETARGRKRWHITLAVSIAVHIGVLVVWAQQRQKAVPVEVYSVELRTVELRTPNSELRTPKDVPLPDPQPTPDTAPLPEPQQTPQPTPEPTPDPTPETVVEKTLEPEAQIEETIKPKPVVKEPAEPTQPSRNAKPQTPARREPVASKSSPPRTAPAPSSAGTVDQQPVVLRAPKPVYPSRARSARLEGVCRLRLSIDRTGRVRGAVVVSSSGHEELDAAALQAVKRWRFRPATAQGLPVDSVAEVPVNFSLR